MPIYTKTGDKGTTALFGGKRVSKADLQVEAYGSVDELTSYIGLVNSKIKNQKAKLFLIEVQKDLYKIMGYLAGSKSNIKYLDGRVKDFENKIDEIDKKLPRLTKFILPGGSELSSWFHVLRTVCRRSERSVIRYSESLEIGNWKLEIIRYLNRLSDLFFTLARSHNKGKDALA
ncbi:ATP:cob(I)alamin adenosyltransferase [Candidatus Roizmanbacteria bacterium RIFCSPLOWO2_01_FULL_35_13]|uniref:Corrinoid adenosyltransferase n=1 Tax=Candidatus Roizmanbacteria bacterium RIFCSPLOWO2_01_FULL_35_13 TaxID=1802055 RepID=A0A1F7IF81_9BACT|nr:MAG: ATP:cob(I)alamin adenosyltransferase [Candidatus Roizmanbacteria bacterium RIFCSPLOWO2_01_FULL_35_13]